MPNKRAFAGAGECPIFDLEMVEAARFYQLQHAYGRAKSYIPVEVAAFIAGACWARQVLVGKKRE